MIATAVAVTAAAAWIDQLVHRQTLADAQRLLQFNADALRDALDRGMGQHYAEVRFLSTLNQVARAERKEDARAALDNFQSSLPQFAWLGLVDPQGVVVASSNGHLEGVNVAQRPWFKGALNGAFVGDVHEAVLLAKLLPKQDEPWRFVDFAIPIQDEQGRLKAVLGAHLSWGWAEQVKKELSDRLSGELGAQALVVGAGGIVLIGPRDLQGKKVDLQRDGIGAVLQAQATSSGSGDFKGLGWQMVVRQPVEKALAPYGRIHAQTFGVAAAVFVLLLPFLWWLSRRLSAPLVTVTQAMQGGGEQAEDTAYLYREAHWLQEALRQHDERHRRHADELVALAGTLEQRVSQRTVELGEANKRLSETVSDLERSEERLASILRQSPDAFVCMDEDGRVTDWNPAAEAMFGWRRDEVQGKPVADLIVPTEHRATHNAGMERFKVSGTGPVIGKRMELPTLHRNGEILPAELSIGATRGRAGHGAFAFIRDIRERVEARQKLTQSQLQLQQVLGNIPAMVGYFDRELRCQYANARGRRIMRLSEGEELGLHLREAIGEENFALHEPHLPLVLAGQRTQFEGSSMQRGQEVHFQAHLAPEKDAAGAVTGFYLMTFDVTDLKEAQLQQERGKRRLRAITDNLPVMISYIDAQRRLQFLNKTFEEWTGVTIPGAIGKTLREVVGDHLYEQRREPLDRALQGKRVEFEVASKALGVERVLHTVYVPDRTTADTVLGVYTLTSDVTALRQAERRMADLALSDSLTGLANRRRFQERLPEALARAARNRTGTGLMFLDIDHFKRINDTFGHAAGDTVLMAFAQRLSACVRATDLVARLAGDEFVVVLEGMKHEDECHVIASKVNAAARGAIDHDANALSVTTSIGMAFLPAGERCASDALLRHADAALYKTKDRGRDGYTIVVVASADARFSTSRFGDL